MTSGPNSLKKMATTPTRCEGALYMISTDAKTHATLTQTRLHFLRERMRESGIGACLVRSTDQYLNEYVPLEESRRTYITGFTGSMGDALITIDTAFLIVDGRYALQAKTECPDFTVKVVTLGQSIEDGWLEEIVRLKGLKPAKIAIENDRIPMALHGKIMGATAEAGLELVSPALSLVEAVWQKLGPARTHPAAKTWLVPKDISGTTLGERLQQAQDCFAKNQLDAISVVLLDDIAWLCDLRSDELPYQATFRAEALAFRDKLLVAVHDPRRFEFIKNPQLEFIDQSQWASKLKSYFSSGKKRVGLDASGTSQAVLKLFEDAGAEVVSVASPFRALKAKKNAAELSHMINAFARADRVVFKTQQWACKQVALGQPITESDVDKKIRAEFYKSGAKGLSFKPICAAGKNGAVIHYGHPDPETQLIKGQLFLLDTGGLYEGGYATDLTRTFLLGDGKTQASELHKGVFTAVLKGAIAGMSARFPKGTTGAQLDAIVRDAIWRMGFTFNHGTGHGVGINVHESPPRIGPGAHVALEEGHVFSIEPGLYVADFGGVRIENLCTVAPDPHSPQFLCVQPLTFAPLDNRLIDTSMLSKSEKTFLKYYTSCFKRGPNAKLELPPIDQSLRSLLPPPMKRNGS